MQLEGIGDRTKVMTFFTIRKLNLLSDQERFHSLFIINSERSLGWYRAITADHLPAAVPEGRIVIVAGHFKRLGLLCPEGSWAGQQVSFVDYLGSDESRFRQIAKRFTYGSFIRLAGNAFHTSSCGHFALAALLLPRFSSFGIVVDVLQV